MRHVGHMGEKEETDTYTIFIAKHEEKRQLCRPTHRWHTFYRTVTYYRVHKIPPLDLVMSQTNTVHISYYISLMHILILSYRKNLCIISNLFPSNFLKIF